MVTQKPKSILKKTGGPGSHGGSSQASSSTLAKNTRENGKSATGSKLKKTISVGRSAKQSKRAQKESSSEAEDEDEDDDVDMSGEEDSEVDTDEEIRRATEGSSSDKKKGQKRKRVTTAETFGSTLTALLAEPSAQKKAKTTTSQSENAVSQRGTAILSKSMAKVPITANEDKLERKALRKLRALKEEKEDQARVRDVVEGWMAADGTGGMEFEKGLRKTAQRGVIKLFNAILVASKNAEAAKTSLSAKAGVKAEVGKRKEKDNVLGRGGKEAGLTKEGFLDLVRKG